MFALRGLACLLLAAWLCSQAEISAGSPATQELAGGSLTPTVSNTTSTTRSTTPPTTTKTTSRTTTLTITTAASPTTTISYCGQTKCKIPPGYCCDEHKTSCCYHSTMAWWPFVVGVVVIISAIGISVLVWRKRRQRAYEQM